MIKFTRPPLKHGLLLGIGLLTGCSSMVHVTVPAAQVKPPASFQAADALRPAAPGEDIRRWWRGWNDPVLDALVAQALAANPDLRSAQANLAASRAQVSVAESALYPTLSANAAGLAGRMDWQDRDPWHSLLPPYTSSMPSTSRIDGYGGGLSGAWEADVFGGRHADADAARALAAIAGERLHGAQVLVVAQVAENYRQLLALRERLTILDLAITTAGELQSYAQARFGAGQAAAADVQASMAQQDTLKAGRPTLQELIEVRRRRLAVLCGRPPQQPPAVLDTLPGSPPPPPPAPQGQLPSDVLARRPDVRARQWAVEAAAAQVRSYKADLLPKFGIVFLGGEGRLEFNGIPDLSGPGGLVGLRISLPLFNAGRLRARVHAGDAQLDAAVGAYDKTVLTALEDVEDAYGMRTALDAHVAGLERSQRKSQRSAQARQALYQAGETTRDSALRARLELVQAEDRLAQARMQQAQISIQLYQALGGGWDLEAAAPKPR